MSKNRLHILRAFMLMVLLGAVNSSLFAQMAGTVAPDSSALKMAFQERTRWSGLNYSDEKPSFLERSYVDVAFGFEDMFEKESTTQMGQGRSLGLSYGVWLSPVHGLEFGYNCLDFNQKDNGISSLDFNYLFNVTSFASKLDTPERWELWIKTGLITKFMPDKLSIGGSVGMRCEFNISEVVGLFVEPSVMLYDSNANGVYNEQMPINSSIAVMAGLTMQVAPIVRGVDSYIVTPLIAWSSARNIRYLSERDSISVVGDDWSGLRFADDSNFWQRSYIDLGYGHEDMFEKTSSSARIQGQTLRVAFGSWFTPIHGLELGCNYNRTYRSEYAYSSMDLNYQFNMTSYASRLEYPERWEVLLKAGVGARFRSDNTSFGVSAAMRGQYNITKRLGVFVEPKVWLLDNSADGDYSGQQTRGNVSMNIIAGLSYNFNTIGDKVFGAAIINDYYQSGDSLNLPPNDLTVSSWDKFLSRTYLDLGYGYENLFEKTSSSAKIQGKTLRTALGGWITPVHGIELGYNYNLTQSREYAYSSVDLNYQFNLTSYALQLNNPNRWEVMLKAGVGTRFRSEDISFGVSAAMRGEYNITKALGVFVEPKVSLMDNSADGVYSPQTRGNVSMNLTAGFSFNLNPVKDKALEVSIINDYYQRGDSVSVAANEVNGMDKFLSRTYLDLGYGYEDLFEKTSTSVRIQGKTIRAALGGWITPVHGLELGYNYNLTKCRDYEYSSMDLNYQFNLTSYALQLNKPNRWEVMLKAGVGTRFRSEDISFGVSVAMRGEYNITKVLGVFVEPKVSLIDNSADGIYTPQTRGNVSMNLTAGFSLRLAPY